MKSVVLLCSILFLSLSTLAQQFHGEFQLGVAGSQVSGDELSGFNKGGLLVGGGVRYAFDQKTSLGFSILYLQKGSRSTNNLANGDTSYYRLRLNYLEFPVLVRVTTGKKLYFELGTSIGYLVKSSEEDQDGVLGFDPYRRNFSKIDFSVAGGFGYPLGQGWDLQIGFWQSLLPVRPHDGGATYHLNHGQYNSVISFSILRTFHPDTKKKSDN
jgi:hypothetical protein